MRIMLLSAEYPPNPGGVGDYTQQLGKALVARGHAVGVLTIVQRTMQTIDLGGLELGSRPGAPQRTANWGWQSWRGVRAAVAAIEPDILHIQYQTGAYGMHPAINLLPWRLRRDPKRPRVVVTAHDLLPPYLFPKAGPLRSWVTRRLLADADKPIVTNQDDLARASVLLKRSASTRPALIPIGSNIALAPPPGYDRNAWRAKMAIEPNQTVVAFFGLISHSKGLHVLLGALTHLPGSVRVLIIGGAATTAEDRAYAERIQRQIADQHLAARVTITGHCAPEQVSAHLLAADMIALPFTDGASYRRGSLLAALAHGVPLITTKPQSSTNNRAVASGAGKNAAPMIGPLSSGENCLMIEPGDAVGLANAISMLADNSGLRERLARGGQALAQQFAWPSIAAQHEALYERL